MKTIVLDTSVIVQDPSILATLKDKFRLVVPSVVLRQIQQMRRPGVSPRLSELLIRAHAEKTIEIVNASQITPEFQALLDPTDATILDVAVEQTAMDSGTVLATTDRELIDVAKQNGVKCVDLAGLRELFVNAKVNEIVLKEAKKFKTRQKIYVSASAFFGAIIAFGLQFGLGKIDEIKESLSTGEIFAGIAFFGLLLFTFRAWFRFSYGFLETVFGLIAVWYSLEHDFEAEGLHTLGIIKVVGSLYIVVRGLENMQKGLKIIGWNARVDKLFPTA